MKTYIPSIVLSFIISYKIAVYGYTNFNTILPHSHNRLTTLAMSSKSNNESTNNIDMRYSNSNHQQLLINRRDALLAAPIVASTCTNLILPTPSANADETELTLPSTTTTSNPTSITFPNSSSTRTTKSSSCLTPNKTNNTPPPKPFPLPSFGLQIYDDDTAYKLTLTALSVGYRNFFASVLAGNQKGFAKAIADSNIPREEIYICGTVLSNRSKGESAAFSKTKIGCMQNLDVMNKGSRGVITYLDMIMLDYPGPDNESIVGQWNAFEEFKQLDLVRDLAVSNFSPSQLDAILSSTSTCTNPTVNQLPFSISYHPPNILEYNASRGIHVQSWSPLSTSLPKYKSQLTEIGKRYDNKSAAQVALRWIVQNGASFCVQSRNKEHFSQDLNVFDFELSEEDMKTIWNL